MRFVVCSYNRGAFLRHCIDTIERCAPDHPVTVMDDASDDPDTLATLEAIAPRHEVLTRNTLSGHKHGGLYENMQLALDRCEEELICYLQDDTQLVRPFEGQDEAALRAAFDAAPDLAFISPCFIRGIALKHKQDRDFRCDEATALWFWYPQKRSTGAFYSDVVIAHRGRLQQVGWRFGVGESANDRQARSRFRRMGHLKAPFAMWLPNVPTYRGKRKTFALRLAEQKRHCGLHPIELLDEGQVARLRKAGQCGDPPIAESWLSLRESVVRSPWRFDPLQGSSTLKWLDRIERSLKK